MRGPHVKSATARWKSQPLTDPAGTGGHGEDPAGTGGHRGNPAGIGGHWEDPAGTGGHDKDPAGTSSHRNPATPTPAAKSQSQSPPADDRASTHTHPHSFPNHSSIRSGFASAHLFAASSGRILYTSIKLATVFCSVFVHWKFFTS